MFGENTERVARESISLRYQLLRYLYSLAKIASTVGLPIMRPLILEFQDDPATFELDTQFMIGPFMMIAPVLEEGANSREVYFPRGIWYDFWADATVKGPQSLKVNAPLDRIPIYMREGSIIPVGRIVQNSDEDQGDLVLWVYPGTASSIRLYEDDGISDAGPSAETMILQESTSNSVVITVNKRVGTWKPTKRSVVIELRGLATLPKSINIDGRRSAQVESSAEFETLKYGSYYDSIQHRCYAKFPDDGSAHNVRIGV